MPVPRYSIPISGLCLLTGILLLFTISPVFAAAPGKAPDQPLRIELEPLGFQPLSSQFLRAGSSMLTLHYVDDQHLLITFNVRRLMHRMPNEPGDDMDRNVDALLLELPSGHILARTTWRLHDHGQYLWNLGHGRFLLRIRDNLTTIAPLFNLASGKSFEESPFLTADQRRIVTLFLSPDQSLLVLETAKHTPPRERPATPLFGPTPPAEPEPPTPVQINFYRLSTPIDSAVVTPRPAGVVRSNAAGTIASTSAGYLAIVDQGHQHWAFDFNSWTGKNIELSPFDSTCRPSPWFVSRSEFIAYGCHNGSTRQVIGGFNMKGEEMWEQNLFGDYTAPSLVFAPATGRFALSRILVRSSAVADQPVNPDDISSQSIIVYQTGTGRQILRAECSPVERAGQNFALSPNGLGLALVHAEAIEVYTLPQLTSKEEDGVRQAEASAPPESDAPIRFLESKTRSDVASAPSDPSVFSVAIAAETTEAAPPPASTQTTEGDPLPDQPRKRPTLYTLPDDEPHAAPPGNQPQ